MPSLLHFKNKSKRWSAEAEFEKKQNIKMVYVAGVPNHKKIKDLKIFLFNSYFSMSKVYHIQFINQGICEFMIDEDYYTKFGMALERVNLREAFRTKR